MDWKQLLMLKLSFEKNLEQNKSKEIHFRLSKWHLGNTYEVIQNGRIKRKDNKWKRKSQERTKRSRKIIIK